MSSHLAIVLTVLLGLKPAPATLTTTVVPCVASGGHAAYVRDWIAGLRTSQEAAVVQFRQQRGLAALPDTAVQVVADSTTCAAAVSAYDAERLARKPSYVPKPLAEREIYVVRMGSDEHVVLDMDKSLSAGHFRDLYWFTGSFSQFVVATTF